MKFITISACQSFLWRSNHRKVWTNTALTQWKHFKLDFSSTILSEGGNWKMSFDCIVLWSHLMFTMWLNRRTEIKTHELIKKDSKMYCVVLDLISDKDPVIVSFAEQYFLPCHPHDEMTLDYSIWGRLWWKQKTICS